MAVDPIAGIAVDVDPHFFRCLARAAAAMAQAEAREFAPLPLRSVQEAQSYGGAIARGKTTSLFGTALCGAAVLQNVVAEQRTRWEQIGLEMGVTYQMVDDCVDLYGAEAAAGKTLGHDLVAGCLTLPVLLAALSLKEQGTPVSLPDLHAGRLAAPDLRLQIAVRSANVMAQTDDHLLRRFANHRKEALEAGLSEACLTAWHKDLLVRLKPCFRSVVSPAMQEPAFVSDRFDVSMVWQRHA